MNWSAMLLTGCLILILTTTESSMAADQFQ